MSFFRCAACGSKNIKVDTKNEGYSVKKGIVGSILFGIGGAVMGMDGKEKKYYHCTDCGQVLSYTMDEIIKNRIDRCLEEPEMHESVLESFKEKYHNIEWSPNKHKVQENLYSSTLETAEDVANALWDYYIRTKISYIKLSDIYKMFPECNSVYDAMRILIEKGVVLEEILDSKVYENRYAYIFSSNPEDIKHNLSIIQANRILDNNEILREEGSTYAINKLNEGKGIVYEELFIALKKFVIDRKVTKDEIAVDYITRRIMWNMRYKLKMDDYVFLSEDEEEIEIDKEYFIEQRNNFEQVRKMKIRARTKEEKNKRKKEREAKKIDLEAHWKKISELLSKGENEKISKLISEIIAYLEVEEFYVNRKDTEIDCAYIFKFLYETGEVWDIWKLYYATIPGLEDVWRDENGCMSISHVNLCCDMLKKRKVVYFDKKSLYVIGREND